MSRRTRDGTVEPVSRGQILRRERGQGNIHFPCSTDHEQDWQPHPVDPYSCYMCDHTKHCTSTKYTTCIVQALHAKHCISISTVCTYKHKHSCTLRTSPRLSMPYTAHVHVQRASSSTRAYAQLVHRQAVHAKHCTSTSTVRTYRHKHSCTLRTLPRLFMPYTVHVQRARLSTRAYAQSVHHPGHPCQTLYKYKHSTCVQAQVLMYTTYAVQAVHTIPYTRTHIRTHDEW